MNHITIKLNHNIIFFICNTWVFFCLKWEKIKASGYPLKMYTYQTEDNFMMGMERIPYSKYGNKNIGKPVILLSGMFASSIVYVSHNQSLGKCFIPVLFIVFLLVLYK